MPTASVLEPDTTTEVKPIIKSVVPAEVKPDPDRHDKEPHETIRPEITTALPRKEEIPPARREPDSIVTEQIIRSETARTDSIVEERLTPDIWHEAEERLLRNDSAEYSITALGERPELESSEQPELSVPTEVATDDFDPEFRIIDTTQPEQPLTSGEQSLLSAWLAEGTTDLTEQDHPETPFEAFTVMLTEIAPLPEGRLESGRKPIPEEIVDEIPAEAITAPEDPVVRTVTERLQALSPEDKVELAPVFEEIRGIVEYIGQLRSQNAESRLQDIGLESEEQELVPGLKPDLIEELGVEPGLLEGLDLPEAEALKDRLTVVCRTLLEALDIHDEAMVERLVETLLKSAERTVKPVEADEVGEGVGTHELKHFKHMMKKLDDMNSGVHRLLGKTILSAAMRHPGATLPEYPPIAA